MQSKHNRKIAFLGIDLVGVDIKNGLLMLDIIQTNLEQLMINSSYLKNAPFLWVGMIFKYGLKVDEVPRYRRIDKKDGELEIEKELDVRVLLTADETDPEFLLKDFFEIATLDCLIHAGRKYKLKIDGLLEHRSRLGQIPEWDPEMDEHPEILMERYKASLPLLH